MDLYIPCVMPSPWLVASIDDSTPFLEVIVGEGVATVDHTLGWDQADLTTGAGVGGDDGVIMGEVEVSQGSYA